MGRDREERRAGKQAAREQRQAERRSAKADRRRAAARSFLTLVAPDEAPTPQARGFADCPCTKDCALHGDCRLCVAYHTGRREDRPRCER